MMESAFAGLPLSTLGQVLAGLGVGAVLGLAHFASLAWNTRLYARGGAALGLAVQLARLALVVAVLYGLVRLGAGALLAGALGFLAARHVVMRRAGGLP